MSMLAVFCKLITYQLNHFKQTLKITNAINIYAGINGIEVGQSFIIGCFIFIHNVIEIYLQPTPQSYDQHIFSISVIVPFLFVTLALLQHNKFPSRVFVGDTFCYFAGMTFAVVAPQIFGFIHCPRHRLPKFNHETYRMEAVHNHFTNINAFLRVFGPTNEQQACNSLLIVQILCCTFGLFIRYFVASLLF